ncbi:hypothetical protein ECZU03_33260 [Escherichia coli]|nr:hypothetical protein ECZU03_33260 [Escherichia coli]
MVPAGKPFDIRQVHERELILNDNGGRSIHFEPLFPGEISYSRSESPGWRGRVAAQHSSQPLSAPGRCCRKMFA